MSESTNEINASGSAKAGVSSTPYAFVSHDARDAKVAEAFTKLLRSVSAGMIKAYHSSDKNAGAGVPFGDEWFRGLMAKLDANGPFYQFLNMDDSVEDLSKLVYQLATRVPGL